MSKAIKLHEGCLYQFSPDNFDRGERMFECPHGRTFVVRVRVRPVEYVVDEKVDEKVDEGTGA